MIIIIIIKVLCDIYTAGVTKRNAIGLSPRKRIRRGNKTDNAI